MAKKNKKSKSKSKKEEVVEIVADISPEWNRSMVTDDEMYEYVDKDIVESFPTTEREYQEYITQFFYMTPEEVLTLFARLPDAQDNEKFVYIPGSKKNKILLVAHADTVFAHPPSRVDWSGCMATAPRSYLPATTGKDGKTAWGKLKDAGLGADDRAGVALMYLFRNSGHSIIITDEEESGCVGANCAALDIPDLLADHQFAIEVDRQGDREYVTYDVASDEFLEYLEEELLPDWEIELGAFTDISELCPAAGICGVNLAAGYMYQHTYDEIFILDAWMRTKGVIEDILSKEHPKFSLKAKRAWGKTSWAGLSQAEFQKRLDKINKGEAIDPWEDLDDDGEDKDDGYFLDNYGDYYDADGKLVDTSDYMEEKEQRWLDFLAEEYEKDKEEAEEAGLTMKEYELMKGHGFFV